MKNRWRSSNKIDNN